MGKINRALVSLSDKHDILDFARRLSAFGVEVISTGGTAKLLSENEVNVIQIADYTGFPEILDGRVKTLHPKIHGGILGMRDNEEHVKTMASHKIEPINMVVVNLYPFEETIAKSDCTLAEAIENIDIGGPTMLRSAAKNYKHVTVIVDPKDYPRIMKEMEENNGVISEETNFSLAKKVFQLTARYDAAISNYLGSISKTEKLTFPETVTFQFEKGQDLRYGENPHQKGAFYKARKIEESCISSATQLQGQELSFNNILDLNAAIETVKEFTETTAVIIKHNNPCGVATSKQTLLDAYIKARDCDPTSAFGGVIAFNQKVDEACAEEVISLFVEAVIAPGFDEKALSVFKKRPNVRILEAPPITTIKETEWDLKKVVGGLLIQDRDTMSLANIKELPVVTKRKPTEWEYDAMRFAWRVCKHVKSNAIVFAVPDKTVGIGAGQMSRVDSAHIAVMKAHYPVAGSVLASDAMFPFRDGVDMASKNGARAIIQPGGSVRDEEVIAAADEEDLAMIFTKVRHFKH